MRQEQPSILPLFSLEKPCPSYFLPLRPQPRAAGLVVVECKRYVFFSDLGFPEQLLSEIYLNCLLARGTELSWTKGIHFGFQTHGIFWPLQ